MAKKTENKKGFPTLPKSGDFVLVHWKKPGMFVLFVYVMSCQCTVKKGNVFDTLILPKIVSRSCKL